LDNWAPNRELLLAVEPSGRKNDDQVLDSVRINRISGVFIRVRLASLAARALVLLGRAGTSTGGMTSDLRWVEAEPSGLAEVVIGGAGAFSGALLRAPEW
jgi:hypothetical protein